MRYRGESDLGRRRAQVGEGAEAVAARDSFIGLLCGLRTAARTGPLGGVSALPEIYEAIRKVCLVLDQWGTGRMSAAQINEVWNVARGAMFDNLDPVHMEVPHGAAHNCPEDPRYPRGGY